MTAFLLGALAGFLFRYLVLIVATVARKRFGDSSCQPPTQPP